jgi:CRISPR-associated protein Cpf1
VESSVYQQFEKALIDKLSYLVDKQQDANKYGGLLKGFQLTNKFTSFRDMKKQNGFLFYIPAWNTSKIDPVTGFVDLLHPKYENVDKARSFFCKFKSIRYNQQSGWYEFTFDYNDFTTQAEGTRTLWTICTRGSRIETYRNKEKNSEWDSREINLTEEFDSLLSQYNISSNDNLKEVIGIQTDKKFFESLIHLLCLTLQMRNSKTGTDIDYLISPVANEDGFFYDSRNCDSSLPENADANGAYNIARKGLWMARQIQAAEKNEEINFVITNKEWLNFAQTKPYLTD